MEETEPCVEPYFPVPNIPRTGETEVSRLVMSFLTTGDLSTLRPLIDELKECNREHDVDTIRSAVIRLCRRTKPIPPFGVQQSGTKREFAGMMLSWFWFDLFDWEASLALIDNIEEQHAQKVPAFNQQPMSAYGTGTGVGTDPMYYDAGLVPVSTTGGWVAGPDAQSLQEAMQKYSNLKKPK